MRFSPASLARAVACSVGGVLTSLALMAPSASAQSIEPHGAMLRFPDVSATHIVFNYAGDLWLVDRAGGVASPLASPPGTESFPRFDAAGERIVFSGNYEGNPDLYVVRVDGGLPQRITYHPGRETVCDWTPAGDILFSSGAFTHRGFAQLFRVPSTGGQPQQVPVPYGAAGAIHQDGKLLAYTPNNRDTRTWKRYRGGMASDVWIYDLEASTSHRVPTWEGTDSQPMWHGDDLYFVSDRGEHHRLNLWMYRQADETLEQVTSFSTDDVRWPAMGPGTGGAGEIVFQVGTGLKLVNLATREVQDVNIEIPGVRPTLSPRRVDASEHLGEMRLSSTGKRAVVEARGDIWTVPAGDGAARNLTRTSGVAERHPSWSPDGRWIACWSDASGEYELQLRQSDGKGDVRSLSTLGEGYRYGTTWSPDSKTMVFWDKSGVLHACDVESGAIRVIDTDPLAADPASTRVSFSPDSRWIAYHRAAAGSRQLSIFLHDLQEGATHQVTSSFFSDTQPAFDREGKYLYFATAMHFQPTYSGADTTFIYEDLDVLHVVPLQKDTASPFAAKSDEEEWEDEKESESEEEGEEALLKDSNEVDSNEVDSNEVESDEVESDEVESDEVESDEVESESGSDTDDSDDADDAEADSDDSEEPEPVEIDLEDFQMRAIPLPIDPGSFVSLRVNASGHLLYSRRGGEEPGIYTFDLSADEPEEKLLVEGNNAFDLSADGKFMLVKDGKKSQIRPSEEGEDGETLAMGAMQTIVDPREEWRQILVDAWRIQRDFFYDAGLHGVDWIGVRDHYLAMLPDVSTRGELSTVIREMISELNVGHAYYWGGDVEAAPSVPTGLLGCDFTLENGAYRISRILTGAAWDSDARGPLSQPGVDVSEGDYLLAVNGIPLDMSRAVWAAFQGLVAQPIVLTVSTEPTSSEAEREVLVETLASDRALRYRAWVEDRRAYVDQMTEGRVGYVYVPNTGVDGQNELFRQYYGQIDKEGFIIDERWNGGGQIPTRFIELLNRPPVNYWARRDGAAWAWPPDGNFGPKCMLINGLSGSGGDAFPAYFKREGLGKLIGTRTWGGLVGISGNPVLIDGGYTSVPTFGYFELDGTWGIEGHGVDPDIEVIDDPARMVDGADPQLNAAISHILGELAARPFTAPRRPAPPDRSGMGIPDADR